MLRVTLLGSPRVERDGRLVTFDTRKATALLAYLAVDERPHSRDSLAGLLWPARDPMSARGALRRTLSVLRTAIGGDVVAADRLTVALRHHEGIAVDVAEFRDLAARARRCSSTHVTCARCLADDELAAVVCRDDFLAGFTLRDSPDFDDWQAAQARELRLVLAAVLERLVRARVATGDLEGGIDTALRWLSVDPLHEPAHAMLMRLYSWADQRPAAMRQYRQCVRTLSEELGVAPLAQTTALDQAIRSGRLAAPPLPVPATSPGPTVGAGPRGAAPPARLPLVGRARELALTHAARAAVGAAGHLVVICGEPGIGKSRLVDELTSAATAAGGPLLLTRCHEGEKGLALGVVTDLLRSALRLTPDTFAGLAPAWQAEVTRLVPELTLAHPFSMPPALDSPGAQGRFFDAVVGSISAALGVGRDPSGSVPVLVVEDVHWADDSSTDLLAYLVRRLSGIPLLLVLTWRPESVPRAGPLFVALTAARRAHLGTLVELTRLDVTAVQALAEAALEVAPTAQDVGRLWKQSGGLPLFVTEYLDGFRRDGRVPEGEQWQLPEGVRDLLQSRLDGLGEATRQVLAAGAVLGSDVTPDLLQATSGRGEDEVVRALEEAVGRAVIEHTNQGTHAFGHEAMQRLVYDTTSLARRRLLHSRAADALIRRRGPATAPDAVAAHLRAAGRDVESAAWSWRAAQRARDLYAHTEALEHLGAAAALGHPGHQVHEASGDVLTALGRYRHAIAAYERAAAMCPPQDHLALATIEHRLAEVHHRLGAWDVAASHLGAALALLSNESDAAQRARVLADIALVAHRRGQTAAAGTAADVALDTATAADDDAALAQAHDVLGVLAAERGDLPLAEHHLGDSLWHAARLADPSYRAAALNNMALLLAEGGRADEALVVAREALQLGLEHGDRHRAAALHTNLADLLHATGEQQQALQHLKAAAAMFAAVDDEEMRRPEIWKLARW